MVSITQILVVMIKSFRLFNSSTKVIDILAMFILGLQLSVCNVIFLYLNLDTLILLPLVQSYIVEKNYVGKWAWTNQWSLFYPSIANEKFVHTIGYFLVEFLGLF